MTVPETVVLPITPYPKGVSLPARPKAFMGVNRDAILPAPRSRSQIGRTTSSRAAAGRGQETASSSCSRCRRARVDVLPRISIDSNSGGLIRCPETAVRSGPNANLGLMPMPSTIARSEEHTSELQSQFHLVCRLLLEKKKKNTSKREKNYITHI